MQRYLDNLRKKPKAVRAQVGFVAAGSITAIFFLIWLVGFGYRAHLDSADPTIAAYQREAEKKVAVPKQESSGIANLFGQIKRGLAGVILSNEQPIEQEKSLEDKVIDINAMIQNPQPRKKQPASATTTSENQPNTIPINGTTTGSVILIGTTTSLNSPENSD